jgi:hypothetical protein
MFVPFIGRFRSTIERTSPGHSPLFYVKNWHQGNAVSSTLSLIGCRIPFFANNASSGYDVATQTQNLFCQAMGVSKLLAVVSKSVMRMISYTFRD